jgi:hypothetical protein
MENQSGGGGSRCVDQWLLELTPLKPELMWVYCGAADSTRGGPNGSNSSSGSMCHSTRKLPLVMSPCRAPSPSIHQLMRKSAARSRTQPDGPFLFEYPVGAMEMGGCMKDREGRQLPNAQRSVVGVGQAAGLVQARRRIFWGRALDKPASRHTRSGASRYTGGAAPTSQREPQPPSSPRILPGGSQC